MVVSVQERAVKVYERLVKEESIYSVVRCPGFTDKNIAEIAEAVWPNVGVFVARVDGPSIGVTRGVMEREGWFFKQ